MKLPTKWAVSSIIVIYGKKGLLKKFVLERDRRNIRIDTDVRT